MYPAGYAATCFVAKDDGTVVTIATSVIWGFSTSVCPVWYAIPLQHC